MDCLYLEIEDQSCLVGSVDQGLMKKRQTDLLDRMTKKRARKKVSNIFPIATLPGIFQPITSKKSLQTFWPNYRHSIVVGLTAAYFFAHMLYMPIPRTDPRGVVHLLFFRRQKLGSGDPHFPKNLD